MKRQSPRCKREKERENKKREGERKGERQWKSKHPGIFCFFALGF
jgi:hypothetical protein